MTSLRNLVVVGLVGSFLMACGSSDDDPPGGSSVDPANCAAVATKAKALSQAVGCKDNSATISSSCQSLYAAKKCTTEWAGLINCIAPRPASDFQCDSDNEFEPKANVCTTEQAAFSTCLGD